MDYISEELKDKLLAYHPEVVLYCPQIPQNTGTISRLCAAFSSSLHLIEPMGFKITEKAVRRAGLDYWEHVNLSIHESWEAFRKLRPQQRIVFVETGGTHAPYDFEFQPQDLLVFGAETFGIHKQIIEQESQKSDCHMLTIPMFNRGVRSINLANTVSIVLYLAIAQLHSKETKK